MAATGALAVTTLEFERKQKGWFWFRKWDLEDMSSICWFTGIHVLAACAPFVFDRGAIRLCVGFALLSAFGMTLGYHRLLCHRSFKIPKWLEYFFVYCGAHAFQRDPMFYVNTHKNHHKYTDTNRDPVTPTDGFWFCNMGWLFNNDHIATKSLLYLQGGFPYLAWAMGMRAVVIHHFAALASYVSHKWGERPWNTSDTSTNKWWVAVLTLGEGWHNNHHAFPRSARHGLEWWQFDPTWVLIKFLQLLGLATNVKLPTEAQKGRISHYVGST
ncbi:hypothetical protein Lser_V15G06544 [Lactuca serriola]